MKIARKLSLVLSLMIVFTAGMSGTTGYADDSSVQWHSYEAGMEKIKSEGKLGFLHFYTDWCTYCVLMNKQTFADKQVADYLNKHFISIRVNAETEKAVAREYGVYQFPSTWFISEDAETIANRPGFIPPDLMITMLKYLHSGDYKKMKFQDYMDARK